MPQFVFLWTDIVLWAMLLLLVWYVWRVRISANLRATWDKVLRDPAALSAAIVLALFALVTMLDSVHFRRVLANAPGAAGATVLRPCDRIRLDLVLARQIETRETAYSRPLAYKAFIKEPMVKNGQGAGFRPAESAARTRRPR
jgi:peptide/nickel transport system permease protein